MKTPIAILSGALAVFAAFAASPAFAEPAYATRNVNVRAGPSLNYDIVDQLVAGEPVEKGTCNSDSTWCYVRHEGDNGWVAAVFLTSNAPGQPEQPPAEEPSGSGDAYTASTQLNIRTGPDTRFAVVDRLDRGEQVTRGQCSDDAEWCYISHDGADGWVAARFLSPVNVPEPPSNTPSGSTRIAVSQVNVRTGPGTNFSIVDRLDGGESVELTQCTDDRAWCYVSHDGPDGWVAANYLRVPSPGPGNQGPGNQGPGNQGPGNQGPINPPMTTQKVGTAIAGMPVRSAPTLFTSTVGHLDRGETVPVESCSTDGYWCHIVSDAIDGWVPAAFLQISEIEVPVVANTAVAARATPMRRIPGNGGAILGMLQAGAEVTVHQCGPAGNWCQVTRNQLTGWVEADALQAPPDTPAQPPAGQQPANSVCFTGFGGLEICLSE